MADWDCELDGDGETDLLLLKKCIRLGKSDKPPSSTEEEPCELEQLFVSFAFVDFRFPLLAD